MNWLHGTAAGLSFTFCIVTLLNRKWDTAMLWLGLGLYALSAALGGT